MEQLHKTHSLILHIAGLKTSGALPILPCPYLSFLRRILWQPQMCCQYCISLVLIYPDLDKLKPGKYNIDSTFVVATISYAENSDTGKVKWEVHRKFLDLQYVISGSAFYAIAPFNKKEISEAYNDSTDMTRVITNKGKYYKATPGTLFVFFPSDAHKSAIKEKADEIVKRVVIKIIYKY